MQFWELINRSNFLKDKFKNIDDHFKEIEINGISNNSKNIKKNLYFLRLLEIKLTEICILMRLEKMVQQL